MELSNLSLAELKNLLNLIPSEIKRREKEEKATALKDLEAFAIERGFTLKELMDSSKEKKERSTVAIKYRHPQNAELTWTGRGRKPKWVVEYTATGAIMDQLAV